MTSMNAPDDRKQELSGELKNLQPILEMMRLEQIIDSCSSSPRSSVFKMGRQPKRQRDILAEEDIFMTSTECSLNNSRAESPKEASDEDLIGITFKKNF
ncbi:hypothetical protein GL50803_007046 [Giardia duodenalis]|uniref:Uncharacterized protein n=2 Tax=Giardia intestinalis TaxID=5741 RepID=A8BIN4_GIAIC|nr:hypothetical protein GL50803_007046 [Giardia intestinalis]ESU39315.1 Hypothetical protein DHA2_7046 [Giardia intestinalis]KAE8305615.1 hypothetical protein GL50803_007046 [Giardia intestinalis]|eukprot:XP_001706871.1 Hypothetical protein GL50803_7046 [Giardia lamblia ATCC 50803]